MSELHIGLVVEGNTDVEIIQAALKAVLPDPFLLTKLQPEPKLPKMGTGWCGVLNWCREVAQRHQGTLEGDPLLEGFDLVILHLDVDVARCLYADCGNIAKQMSVQNNLMPLPVTQPCPPVYDTTSRLEGVLRSWLHPAEPGPRAIICLPAQSSGSWLAAASLPDEHPLLEEIECNPNAESGLSQLSKDHRIRKNVREYRQHAPKVTQHWDGVKQLCSQARKFEEDLFDTGLLTMNQ